MSTRRILVNQNEGPAKKVAFLDDVTLTGLTGTGLISVTGTGKEKVVTTDSTKLTLSGSDVNVATPLVLSVQSSTPSTTANRLYSVNDGTENKLYWNGKIIDAHAAGEGFVLESTYNAHVANSGAAKHVTATELGQLEATEGKDLATEEWVSANFADKGEFDTLKSNVTTLSGNVTTLTTKVDGIESDVDTIEANYVKDIIDSSADVPVQVVFGNSVEANKLTSTVNITNATQDSTTKALSGTGLVNGTQAQDAISAAVSNYNTTVVGAWTTISDKTVKAAIEENKAKIAALEGNHFEVVDELPPVSEGKFNVIYLVPDEVDPTVKDEFILIEEGEPATRKWEQIGTTKADLSNYYTKAQADTAIANAVATEETRAKAAEGELETDLATEVTRATGAEQTLTANLAAETTRATGAEAALDAAVDALDAKVGTIPDGATSATVVEYVTEKATAVANSAVSTLSGTADTASAHDTASFVTVSLTGTVGNHGLTVTTSDIAKASEVGQLSALTTTNKATVVAAVNEVNGKASSALQTVTSADTANLTAVKNGTDVMLTPVGTLADLLAYCSITDED